MYQITTSKQGSLLVQERPLDITSASAEKVFDGQPLIKEEIQTVGDLLPGDRIVPDFANHPIHSGSLPNSFALRILNAADEDVSNHYEVTTHFGTLTVHPASGQVSFTSSEKDLRWD
jgi:hypothetical protein